MKTIKLHPVVLVTLLNAFVAVAAFVKDVVLAMFLGTSVNADAFALANFIPDMLGNLLMGAAVGTVCVPVFSKIILTRRRSALTQVIKILALQVLLLSVLVYTICLAGAHGIVEWFGGGRGPLAALMLPLFYILLPTVLLFPLSAVGASIRKAFHRFPVTMAAPAALNLGVLAALMIAMGVHFTQRRGAAAAAWGLLAGVVVMTLLNWLSIRKLLKPGEEEADFTRPDEAHAGEIRKIWSGFGIYVLILFFMQAVYLMERYLAARTGTGAVAALNYAFRLTQMPIWVYVYAFGTVILPRMSQQLVRRQSAELRETVLAAMRSILLVTIPTAVLLWTLREPVTVLLFKRGAFDMHSAALTAGVLQGYALTIVFQSVSATALRYFLAAESLRGPVLIMLLASGLNIGLDMALTGPFGVRGIGWGAVAGTAIGALGFVWLLHRSIDLRELALQTARLLAANAPSALLLAAYIRLVPFAGLRHFIPLLAALAGAALLYGLPYLWTTRRLKLVEFRIRGGAFFRIK